MNAWLGAFLLTLALELPVYAAFLRRALPGVGSTLLLVLLVNLATHPFLWWTYRPEGAHTLALLWLEARVVLVEAVLLHLAGHRRDASWPRGPQALLAALLANLLSVGVGLALHPVLRLFG